MRNNSYRNQISTGAFTLPVAAGIMALLWMMPGLTDLMLWAGLGMAVLTAFLLAELSNRNALIRVRSRLVSSVFFAFFMACPSLHHWSKDLIPMVCLMLSYFQLFETYQNPHPEGSVFASFLFLGISSWFYPPLLICAIVLYFALLVPLRAMTWRTGIAGLFGLMLPYWFYAGWAIWHENIDVAFQPFLQSFHFSIGAYSALPLDVLTTAGLLILLSVLSIFHFSHTAYNDKIRTRMFYYVIISIEIFLLIALLLQPQHYGVLLSLLIANSAPLVAHHYALGRGKILDYAFIVCFIVWGTLTLFNFFDLWTLLSNF